MFAFLLRLIVSFLLVSIWVETYVWVSKGVFSTIVKTAFNVGKFVGNRANR